MKVDKDDRFKAIIWYSEKIKSAKDICYLYNISGRTFRRWLKAYKEKGIAGLEPLLPIPKKIKRLSENIETRILRLKQKHPSWGARRIKYQFNLSCSWISVHRILKKYNLLIRIKAKPQPCRRFQRKHVNSMWQGDTFQFRIKDVGKVYVTGFTDDCSRYRVNSGVYLKKDAEAVVHSLKTALSKGRAPQEIYLDNGKQFVSKLFKSEARKHKIKLTYGKPYHPKGRGKIEAYHKTLYRELITQKHFDSLLHFKKELRKYDKKYNYWRKQQIHNWQPPAAIYNNPKYFNKTRTKDQLTN